ncbi:MAG TPA: hypothetical protein VK477_04125, partial [Acidobacteriota bacterium]|nr:hypothetical protein [Acidobacteriota bacterium]
MLVSTGQAQSLYWFMPVSSTWDTTQVNWSTTPSAAASQVWANTGTYDAYFINRNEAVSVAAGGVTVKNLFIQGGSSSFSG